MTANPVVWRLSDRLTTARRFEPADEAERLRAVRLRDADKAQDFLHARHLMRELACETFGLRREEARLEVFDDARPHLTGHEEAGISWARSGPKAVAACVRQGRLGVDVERNQPVDIQAMLSMIAGEGERASVLSGGGGSADLQRFYRLWCAKEAVLKWRGTGLRGGAKSVTIPDTFIAGTARQVPVVAGGGMAELLLLDAGADCVAVLALSR